MRLVYPRERKNWGQLERASCSKGKEVGMAIIVGHEIIRSYEKSGIHKGPFQNRLEEWVGS